MLIWLKNQRKVRYRTFQLRYGADAPTVRCEQRLGLRSGGIDWESFNCALSEDQKAIECNMVGLRDPHEYVTTYLIPSAIFFVISFSSTCLPVGMSMPRTAVRGMLIPTGRQVDEKLMTKKIALGIK